MVMVGSSSVCHSLVAPEPACCCCCCS
jgi:hypothetical protein